MPSFLFTAVNHDEQSVTERIEAENLSQARFKLEIRGYSEIAFYESELSGEADRLFDPEQIKAKNEHLKNQVSAQYDTSIGRYFINLLKASWIFWLLIAGSFLYTQNTITLLLLIGVVGLAAYISVPVIIFNRLFEAHGWDKNGRVRFWGKTAKLFNKVSFIKLPHFEIDTFLSSADAREGDLDGALRRIAKYQNDPQVSGRLYNTGLVRIYGNARDFDKVLEILENSLSAENAGTEEMLDYAICLARRHRETARAKTVLQRLLDTELTVMAGLFVPYCQGIIEVEEGNFSQAEFYLKQASKKLEPFRKNSYLVGLKSEVKAFLAIALGRRGQKDEAARLFREAAPYLAAVREKELLRRCEEALS